MPTMPPNNDDTIGDSSSGGAPHKSHVEMKNLLKDGASKGKKFVDMLVPASPLTPRQHGHAALGSSDDDLHDESHKISDNFEIEGGESSDDEGSDGSSCHDGGGAHGHGMAPGTATSAQVAVNIFISFVGAGLLGLPYAFSRSGWLLGSMSLAAVSSGNVYAMLLLVKCRKRLEEMGHTGIKGYGDVGREVMGPRGEVLVNICLVISQAGFATAYLIFIAANVRSIVEKAGRGMIIYSCVPLLALLVQFRDMKKLSPFSLIADGTCSDSDCI